MPTHHRALLAGLIVAAGLTCDPAHAQAAVTLSRTAPRVLSDITDAVKDDDGSRVTLRTVLTYDPAAGEYVQTVTDVTAGREATVRRRDVKAVYPLGPTASEDAAAQSLVALDPDVAPLISRAPYPVRIQGGFPLVREAGHACGPGSRCLQYEVLELVPGEPYGRRLRYVVVDLQAVRVLSSDFDPDTEGNLATPAARAQSRQAQPRNR